MSRAVILGRPVSGQFSADPSFWRKALVVAALPVALFAAVAVQLTIVNRLPLPGGTGPDLVLLLVAAVAVSTGPMTGLLTGFAGGLALDLAPPATHYAGEYALVFCVVGYLAGRAAAASGASTGERNPWVELGVMAAATAAGEAGKAGLGLLLSDPDVTGPAIKHVLPAAVLWDLLLTPFAFFLVTWVAGLARPVAERAPRPEFVGAARLAAVFRAASAGAAPNLKLAGSGAKFTDERQARRVPKLRLADARSKSFARTDAAGSGIAPPALAGRRTTRLKFGHSASALRSAGAGVTRGGRTPKLKFSGPSSAITPPRSQKGPGKGWIRAAGGAGGARAAASGTGARSSVPVAGRRKPAAGWLRTDAHRPVTAKRATPGKGWLRPSRRPRANWYSSGPSTRWVRRSRSKDRWRTRRRSLSGAVMSGVRDLLPSGDRR